VQTPSQPDATAMAKQQALRALARLLLRLAARRAGEVEVKATNGGE
jgi:hypothetical protein